MNKLTAKDLMIGDWVYYKDKKQMPCRVISIIGNYIRFDDGTQQDWMSDVKNFTPIPLTAEILVKIGFVKGEEVSDTPPYDQDEEGNMYYSFRGELKFWGWWQPDNTYYIPANAMGDIIIRYVHELQHALRLAGIDKEITI